MATYTLSHTGAEVDAAVNNATNLFSTAHTWTADQTFRNVLLPTGTLDAATVAGANANFGDLLIGDYPNSRLTVDAPARFTGATEITAAGSFTVGGPASFAQNITVTGDVTAGSATIGGDLTITGSITSSLRVTGRATFTNVVEAGDGIDNRGTISFWEGSEENFGAYMHFTHTAIASADMAGVYIDKTGIHAFSINDPIPANVLLIEFDY